MVTYYEEEFFMIAKASILLVSGTSVMVSMLLPDMKALTEIRCHYWGNVRGPRQRSLENSG